MKIEASVFHSKNEKGSFNHSIEIPSDVKSVVFGNMEFEIWNVESLFRTGVLTKHGHIKAALENWNMFFIWTKLFQVHIHFPKKNTKADTSDGFEMIDWYEENNSIILKKKM